MKFPLVFATLIFTMAVVASGLARGQENSNLSASKPDSEQIAVLQAQLDTMRAYDGRLLNTAYWSLGVSFTIVVLVVGLGWYTNFRIYKRDVKDIETGVQALLAKEKTQALEELKAEIDNVISRRLIPINTKISALATDVARLEYKMSEFESNEWERKGVVKNALRCRAKMIPYASSIGGWVLAQLLDEFVRLLRSNDKLDLGADLATDLRKALSKIPLEFKDESEMIKALIDKSRA